jgi:hypothetical protein
MYQVHLISCTTLYCNVLVGSIHNGNLLHSEFSTQLLITVSNSSRILTHVQLILKLQRMRSFSSGPSTQLLSFAISPLSITLPYP